MTDIPNSVIGVIAKILSEFYTHKDLDRLFRVGGEISLSDFNENKAQKIMHGLDIINEEARKSGDETAPLAALGKILEDYMDAILPEAREDFLGNEDEYIIAQNKQREENREKIKNSLRNKGFSYQHDGVIVPLALTAQPILTLTEQIESEGLSAVQQEITGATQAVQNGDSAEAIRRAGVLLEAVYKAYLDSHKQAYNPNETAAALWQKLSAHLGIRPGEQNSAEWRDIYSSLHKIAQNIMQLRNQYGSHGQNQAQHSAAQAITSAQAQLAVNSASVLATYILTA